MEPTTEAGRRFLRENGTVHTNLILAIEREAAQQPTEQPGLREALHDLWEHLKDHGCPRHGFENVERLLDTNAALRAAPQPSAAPAAGIDVLDGLMEVLAEELEERAVDPDDDWHRGFHEAQRRIRDSYEYQQAVAARLAAGGTSEGPAAGIDVERLARALHTAGIPYHGTAEAHEHHARRIAAEYEAAAAPESLTERSGE